MTRRPPLLGELCVPGCHSTDVDPDGAHLCLARIGAVPACEHITGRGHRVAVDVTEETEQGRRARLVALVVVGPDGRPTGDEVVVDAGALAALVELLEAARVIGGAAW